MVLPPVIEGLLSLELGGSEWLSAWLAADNEVGFRSVLDCLEPVGR